MEVAVQLRKGILQRRNNNLTQDETEMKYCQSLQASSTLARYEDWRGLTPIRSINGGVGGMRGRLGVRRSGHIAGPVREGRGCVGDSSVWVKVSFGRSWGVCVRMCVCPQ